MDLAEWPDSVLGGHDDGWLTHAELADLHEDANLASLASYGGGVDGDQELQALLSAEGDTHAARHIPAMRASFSMNDLAGLQRQPMPVATPQAPWANKLVSTKPRLQSVPEGGPSNGGPLNLLPLPTNISHPSAATASLGHLGFHQGTGAPGSGITAAVASPQASCVPLGLGDLRGTPLPGLDDHMDHDGERGCWGGSLQDELQDAAPGQQGGGQPRPTQELMMIVHSLAERPLLSELASAGTDDGSGDTSMGRPVALPAAAAAAPSSHHKRSAAAAGAVGGALGASTTLRKSQSALELGAWRGGADESAPWGLDGGGDVPWRLTPEERAQRIQRYRDKRLQRNYQRAVKYQCRKSLADTRPRVKGRFARTDDLGATLPHETKKALLLQQQQQRGQPCGAGTWGPTHSGSQQGGGGSSDEPSSTGVGAASSVEDQTWSGGPTRPPPQQQQQPEVSVPSPVLGAGGYVAGGALLHSTVAVPPQDYTLHAALCNQQGAEARRGQPLLPPLQHQQRAQHGLAGSASGNMALGQAGVPGVGPGAGALPHPGGRGVPLGMPTSSAAPAPAGMAAWFPQRGVGGGATMKDVCMVAPDATGPSGGLGMVPMQGESASHSSLAALQQQQQLHALTGLMTPSSSWGLGGPLAVPSGLPFGAPSPHNHHHHMLQQQLLQPSQVLYPVAPPPSLAPLPGMAMLGPSGRSFTAAGAAGLPSAGMVPGQTIFSVASMFSGSSSSNNLQAMGLAAVVVAAAHPPQHPQQQTAPAPHRHSASMGTTAVGGQSSNTGADTTTAATAMDPFGLESTFDLLHDDADPESGFEVPLSVPREQQHVLLGGLAQGGTMPGALLGELGMAVVAPPAGSGSATASAHPSCLSPPLPHTGTTGGAATPSASNSRSHSVGLNMADL